MNQARIYLDNAATSWPKPPAVIDALTSFYRFQGRAAGRGSYAGAVESGQIVADTRQLLASFFNLAADDHVVFAHSGTDALNLALLGLLNQGDRVLVSPLEHNSILRPLYALRESTGILIEWLRLDETGRIDLESLQQALRVPTRLVCLTHASNVTGTIQPAAEICALCRSAGVLTLLDASQTAGHLAIDFSGLQADLLATAGHKGLMGPLGTGLLLIGGGAAPLLRPSRFGGTGSESERETQPARLPDRLESGNLDVGGIAGLAAGVRFLMQTGVAEIHRHHLDLEARLFERLEQDGNGKPFSIQWIGQPNWRQAAVAGTVSDRHLQENRIAVTSLAFPQRDVHEVAAILDASFGIEVRAGLHCAPLAAGAVSRRESAAVVPVPTVRISPGWYNKISQIDLLATALIEILAE